MKLVFASNNQNKIREVASMMPTHIMLLSLSDIGCTEDIPETADTIEGNAVLKANYVLEKYGYDCFADDTGLEISALNGAPGVYSARYAGPQRNANDNMDKVLKELASATDRSAQFKTVIALNVNGKQHLFTGIVKGQITREKTGLQGFGYDRIFRADGHSQTFAQLSPDQKALVSHRGTAVRKLIEFLEQA